MNIKLYCKNCGTQLEKLEVKDGFHRATGKEILINYLICPKYGTKNDIVHDRINENSDEIEKIVRMFKLEEKEKEYNEKQKKVKKLIKELEELGTTVKVTHVSNEI